MKKSTFTFEFIYTRTDNTFFFLDVTGTVDVATFGFTNLVVTSVSYKGKEIHPDMLEEIKAGLLDEITDHAHDAIAEKIAELN